MERCRASSWFFLLLLAVLVPCLSAMPAAGATWQPLSLWGGGVRLVAAVDDPSVVYAVTSAAGIFRSADRGATWQLAGYPPERSEVRAIAVDPHDEQRLFITAYAPAPAFSYFGFYRSEDGGRRWRRVVVPGIRTVFDVAFDPQTPGVVYAAGQRGLFRSSDGGTTWTRTAFAEISVEKIAVALSDSDVLFASVFQGDVRTTWRSTDGGQTFTQVLNRGLSGFAFDPAQPQQVYGFDGGTVFVSDDLGATWTSHNGPFTLRALAVTPSGTLLSGGDEGGVRRSTDEGATWVPAAGQPARPEAFIASLIVIGNRVLAGGARGVWRSENQGQGWRAASTGLRAHSIHVLDVGEDGTVWAGTFGGVFLGRNEGESFQLLRGLGPRAFLDLLAVHPVQSDVAYAFGCCGENEDGLLVSGLIKTEDGGATWRTVPYTGVTRETALLEVDPVNPDIVYAGGIVEPHGGGACTAVRSTDGGATWSCMTGIAASDFTELAIDPRRPQNLFAVANGLLYRSTDQGETWARVPTRTTGFRRIEVDPFRSERLYAIVGTILYRSDNGGRTWRPQFTVEPAGGVQDILLDPQRRNRIWLTAEYLEFNSYESTSRVFRSDNAGESWSEESRGLRPGTVILHLVADPDSADVIYAGTEGQGLLRLVVD